MKPKKLTNAYFLRKVKALEADKDFVFTDETGKTWTGEMAIARYFGMTRVQFRAKKAEALKEARAAEEAKNQKKADKPAKKSGRYPWGSDDENSTTLPVKMKWIKTENYAKDGRYYMELPDGLRLVFGPNGYEGHYNPNLNEVV